MHIVKGIARQTALTIIKYVQSTALECHDLFLDIKPSGAFCPTTNKIYARIIQVVEKYIFVDYYSASNLRRRYP
jgi:hypothetical protein